MITSLLFVLALALIVVGISAVGYEIYQLVLLDANARGLKHPKLWGFFSLGGNNSSNLLIYLIGRRKYPISTLSIEKQEQMAKRKKIAGVAIIFCAGGALLFITTLILSQV